MGYAQAHESLATAWRLGQRMNRLVTTLCLYGLLALQTTLRADEASELLAQSGIKGGVVVHADCGDGSLTLKLRPSAAFQVQGLLRGTPAEVQALRLKAQQAGLSGVIGIDSWAGEHLPYIENFVNLLVVEKPGDIKREEILRVLAPLGVAMLRQAGRWEKISKPWPKEMDEWTHYAYDSKGNPTCRDMLVGPPSRMQWVGSPRWSRHHDRMSSVSAKVSAGGRLFYIMDEGSRISILMPAQFALIARDAFNGTVLWKKPIPKWSTHLWPLKSGPTQLARRLVAVGDRVYVTLGIDAPVVCLDGASGELIRQYPQTEGTEEILIRNGVLYALVNKEPWRLNQEFAVKAQSDQKRVEEEFNWDGKERRLLALELESGNKLWEQSDRIAPITLAIDDKRLVYYDGEGIAARSSKDGSVLFSSGPQQRRKLYEFNFAPRVLLHNDVIIYAGGNGEMKGMDANSGKDLWVAPHEKSGYRSLEDVVVAQGLVWNSGNLNGNQSGEYRGFDPLTGEKKRSFFPDVPEGTYWFHHRCYMGKATERFLIPSRTGIEYVDMEKKHWDLNHWVRGACLYGVLPANGLTYAGPHNCACYPEAKLDGMAAMADVARHPLPAKTKDATRLWRGEAYAEALEETPADVEDWPTYRADNARSGAGKGDLRKDLGLAWEVRLNPPLSASTSAAGQTYVSEVDRHTLHAFDSASGKPLWKFVAGGRIDSPPSYWAGRVFFGGKDGRVYCLRAKDGALLWQYDAAPIRLSHSAWEMMESVWPVHGSVLVENGLVSFVAGRSCFLDGGLWFHRLDAKTGELRHRENYDDRDPDTGGDLNDRHKSLQMPVALNDILSSDGNWTYLRTQKIDPKGKRIEVGPVSGDFAKQGGAHKGEGKHLFAPTGFLDDSNFHRSYWVYGKSFAGGHGGYFQAGKYAPAGRILVHDQDKVFSYGREAQYYKWTTTMEYTLFSTPKEPPPEAYETAEATTPRQGNSLVLGPDGQPIGNQPPALEKPGKKKGEGKKAMAKAGAKGKGKAVAAAGEPPLPGSVILPNDPLLDPSQSARSLEAWVLLDEGNGTVLHHGGPLQGLALDITHRKPAFHVRAEGELRSIQSTLALTEGWHHLVATLDQAANMQLYVDGRSVAQGKASALLPSKPARPQYLGNGSGVTEESPGPLRGLLDQVAIYKQALTAEEVQARFESPESRPQTAVAFYNFDNGDSRDSSGNNLHGIGAAVETGKGKVGAALWFKGGQIPGPDKGSFVRHDWDRFVPIVARSMALAGNTVLVGGAPDTIDEEYAFERLAARDPAILKELEEQNEALEGRRGAKLWAVNTQNGEQSQGLELQSPPVWDGISTAKGRVFVSTMDGRLQCFGR